MITLTARIDLISGNNYTLSTVLSNLSSNNISSEIGAILGVKSKGSNPFIFGASKFGDGSTFSGNVDYFIGNELCDENGNFQKSFDIRVFAKEDISSITFAFDTVNNRHPKSIWYGGNEHFVDDAIFTITNINTMSPQIFFSNWNTPNYPAVITGIYIDISIDINQRNLIAFNRNISYRGDNKLPSYGIISNTGNLEFNDLDGEVKDYAEQMLLTSDLKVVASVNNTLTKTSEQIGVFETKDWDYDNDNRSVSVSLKDDLEEWQDIQVQGFNYDPRNAKAVLKEKSMANLYVWLRKKTPYKYRMLEYYELDDKTKSVLSNTTIEYPFLENGTLWEQWQKLCEVCGLYIYKNNDGKTICTYTYGS